MTDDEWKEWLKDAFAIHVPPPIPWSIGFAIRSAMSCQQCSDMGEESEGPYFYKNGVQLCAVCAGLDPDDFIYEEES